MDRRLLRLDVIGQIGSGWETIGLGSASGGYDFVYVDEEGFKKYTPSTFQALMDGFREYKSN